MTIEIKIQDLQKAERGTHRGPVRVTRGGTTFVQSRRLGRKELTSEEKINMLPDTIKNEILKLWKIGRVGETKPYIGGTTIKDRIEEMLGSLDNKTKQKLIDNDIFRPDRELNRFSVPIASIKDWAGRNTKIEKPKKKETIKVGVKRNSGRTGTGKIDKLPESIKNTILDMRESNESGANIKSSIENSIYLLGDAEREKLLDTKVIDENGKLTVTGQGLTNWAKSKGVEGKTRKTVKQISAQKDKEWSEKWDKLNTENSTLEIKLREAENNATAQRTQKLNMQNRLENCQTQLLQTKNK